MATPSRWLLIGSGVSLLLFWFLCSAATVVPGSAAQVVQFAVLVTFPVLAGVSLWVANRQPPGSPTVPSVPADPPSDGGDGP